jgi:hypothetical protein
MTKPKNIPPLTDKELEKLSPELRPNCVICGQRMPI